MTTATLPTNRLSELVSRETRPTNFAQERVILLGLIYLQAGLQPEAAYRSAVADYECGIGQMASRE